MVQKIRNPVERDRSLPAPGRTLNDQDPVLCIPDDLILFLLDRADDAFQLSVPAAPQLLL